MVLAIIALIAVPIVLNIIEKSRQGAAISSARNYIKAVETYVVTSELDKNRLKLDKNNKYNVTKDTIIESKNYIKINDLVSLKGSKPTGSDDYVILGETKQVTEALLTINGYEILIKDDKVVSVAKGKIIKTESITLKKEHATIEVNETLQLIATIIPDNATNKTVTWKSSDENIAIVDENGSVTGKKLGKVTIIVTTSNGKSAIANITVDRANLSDVVNVGDYVAYNVGTWTSSAPMPTSQERFGGYIEGQNKLNSILCHDSTTLKGWRVLKIENDQVYLVHAGIPECYYNEYGNSEANVISLNNRATSEYLNSTYATSAHMMTKEEVDIIEQSNDLRTIGARYWLASPAPSGSLWGVGDSGYFGSLTYDNYGEIFGVRPVIILKQGIKTTGKTIDAVGQVAWNLIAP